VSVVAEVRPKPGAVVLVLLDPPAIGASVDSLILPVDAVVMLADPSTMVVDVSTLTIKACIDR
jgi:hypothetical protein